MIKARKIPFEIVLFLLAAFLRLRHLGKQSLWIDEAFSVWTAAHPLRFLLQILEVDAHPPLFYALLHGWLHYGHSEAFLRLPFTLFGAVNAILVYRLGKLSFNQKTAVAASLFWAISFPMLNAETQVRMYAMATTFSLLATLFFLQAFRRPSFSRWLLYFLSASLCLYTHYYTVFLLAAHLLFLILHKRIREFTRLSLSLTAVFLPWSYFFFQQLFVRLHNPPEAFRIGVREFSTFSSLLGIYDFLASGRLNLGISLILLFGICGIMFHLYRRKNPETRLLILTFLLSSLLPFSLAVSHHANLYSSRYSIFFAPYFYLFFFYGFLKLPRSVTTPLIFLLVFVNLAFWKFFTSSPAYERQNWREASFLLQSQLKPGDYVLVNDIMLLFPFWYYLPGHFGIAYFPGTYVFQIIPNFRLGNLWIPAERNISSPALRRYSRASKRQWLILFQDNVFDPKRKLLHFFLQREKEPIHAKFISFEEDNAIDAFLFTPKPP